MHPIYNFNFFLCKFNFEYKYKRQLFVFAVHFPQLNIYNTFYIWKWIQKQYFL